MSKLIELDTVLDEMNVIGRTLIECGENLRNAAACVMSCIMAEDEAEAPAAEPPRTYTKEEGRVILGQMSVEGCRNQVRELVSKYSDGGSLTDIDPAKYPALIAEAAALRG